jgi:alkanesulfonate monooxygenase SsuD/methylene tetrahydromethanopterin reductase-like flavin-dependent oxidoreductase (luciferase family)
MKFGAQLVNYFTGWEATLATIETLEAGRWNSLWFSDHFLPPTGPAGETHAALESWSMITAAAAVTKRLRLGVAEARGIGAAL